MAKAETSGGSPTANITLQLNAAALTAPMVLHDGQLVQNTRTELPEAGRAVFTFRVPRSGQYVVSATVFAPDEGANSCFVNIDAEPPVPEAIWDIPPTDGLENRLVGWRGLNGLPEDDEFTPKVFVLDAGEHRLIIAGRERTQIRSVSILPYTAAPAPAAGTIEYLQEELSQASKRYRRAVAKLPDEDASEAKARDLRRTFDAEQTKLLMDAVKLAQQHPNSEVGLTALTWVLENYRSYYVGSGPIALSTLTEQYASDPRIRYVLAWLAHLPPYEEEPHYAAAMKLLDGVLKENPDRFCVAAAKLARARESLRDYQKREALHDVAGMAAPKAAAEKAFEELVRDYADCPFTRSSTEKPKSTIGEIASRELHELRQLSIGCEAPEISGVDLDGHGMSLSDYRGKVVLLVFWASWCGPCMADVPHEKELIDRFKGRPFTIVGINGDTTLNAAQKAVSQNQMLWRSFWPRAATGGDIARQWNVRVWPTVYVIDHRGIIREKDLRREELDEPLNTLIVAAEAKAP